MVVAGIDNGYIDRYTQIYDKCVFNKYDGFSANCLYYTNYGWSHGSLDCTQALQWSCNYFFYELADQMKISEIDEVAKGLGLGVDSGVELTEYTGYRANPETKYHLFAGTDSAGWYPADQVMTGIGQSYNKFTPMQLASYLTTLVNQGVRYKATFLDRVVESDYSSVLFQNFTQILSTMEISDEAFEAYTTGMRLVVSEPGGTAYTSMYNYPIAVAGKTGTVETDAGSDNGAFMCYAPYDDPQIAIVVYGEKAGGGTRLINVAKAIMDVYFGIDSDSLGSGENQLG